jgi:uncharacterized protein YndB with AHSA1/START domain
METIATSIDVQAAPARVYEAVSTTAGHRAWWTTDCEVGSKVGEPATFRFKNKDGSTMEVRFRIDKLAPGQAVEMTCVGHVNNPEWENTKLALRLRAAGDGTRVDLHHSGFAAKTPLYQMCVDGWSHFMASLKAYLETGKGTPFGG